MTQAQNLNFVDPGTVVGQLSVAPGSIVADFGCGSGYFSFEFAKRVGKDGAVYALDVLPSALEAVTSHAKTLGIQNVMAKRVNLENEQGSGLSGSYVDWVVLKDVLLQNQKKDVLLREVARVLKPGGQALVMEWNPDESLVGPEKSMRIGKEELKTLLGKAGLTVSSELSVGGFHYAFIVKK